MWVAMSDPGRWAEGADEIELLIQEGALGRVRHVIKPFNRLRIIRNEADYPSEEHPALSSVDVLEDLPAAADIVDAMKRLVPRVGAF